MRLHVRRNLAKIPRLHLGMTLVNCGVKIVAELNYLCLIFIQCFQETFFLQLVEDREVDKAARIGGLGAR